ncbi:MAG: hypothetical protein KKG99_13895 [Bacteroidetes bacterium]|nr:hypothetical protein [Bacteroidota bacterium]
MNDKKSSIKNELIELIQFGRYLYYNEALIEKKLSSKDVEHLKKLEDFILFKKKLITTKTAYHKWYSKSLPTLRQLLPDRVDEFQKLYIIEKRNIKEISYLTYTISDYFLGLNITKGWEKN